MAKLTNQQIVNNCKGIKDFPPVLVDQTNFRISEIIKRNRAGEQVLGNQNLSFDYTNESKSYDPEKVNPFNDIGFDLDDVIRLAKQKSAEVTDLQNKLGDLKRALDESQQEEQESISTPPISPKAEENG